MSACDAIRDWLVAEAWRIGDTRALLAEWAARLVATPYLAGRAEPLGSHAGRGFPDRLAAFAVHP